MCYEVGVPRYAPWASNAPRPQAICRFTSPGSLSKGNLMDVSMWLLFLATAVVTALTPGPGVIMVVSRAVGVGVRAAMLCSLGNEVGLCIVSSATMVGLGALLKSSALLFAILKLLGAGYLIYLGMRQWRAHASVLAPSHSALRCANRGGVTYVCQGMLVATTNPKAIVFFTALFPQFLDPDKPILLQFVVITTTFVMATMASHGLYVFFAYHAKGWLSATQRVKVFNRIAGGAYMLLGVAMLRFKHNPS
jgi:threonine/homoserine/homoserine lactone efflux protein